MMQQSDENVFFWLPNYDRRMPMILKHGSRSSFPIEHDRALPSSGDKATLTHTPTGDLTGFSQF